MKKIFLLLALLALFISPQKIYAHDRVAQTSAKLVANTPIDTSVFDMRVKALTNVFKKHNSPLAEQAPAFVKYADVYGVDWKLLPSISGLESSFGIFLLSGSHNAYGWGGGYIYFASWEEGIKTINQALRQNYINRGAADVWSIGPIYAESPTWAVRVARFMREIDEEYTKLSTITAAINI